MTPKNVRTWRIALGMTVDEPAKAIGLSPALLRDFEMGAVQLKDAEKYRPSWRGWSASGWAAAAESQTKKAGRRRPAFVKAHLDSDYSILIEPFVF